MSVSSATESLRTISSTSTEGGEVIKLNPKGIRKLDPDKIQSYLSPKFEGEKPLFELIDTIIAVENVARQERAEKENKLFSPIVPIEGEQWDPSSHFQFDCKCFHMTAAGVSKEGKAHEQLGAVNPFDEKWRSLFTFFYREKTRELYALGHKHTWEVLRPYTDYSFPGQFCRRYLDPKKVRKVVRETVFGDVRTEALSFSGTQRMGLLEGRDKLYSQINLTFRRGIPLLKLPIFLTPKGNEPNKDIGVTVQVGQIRIHKSLALQEYPQLLDHFSKKETIPKQVEDQFEVLDYLQKVEEEKERATLQSFFLNKLGECLKKGTKSGFVLHHKFHNDFLDSPAESLVLSRGRRKVALSLFSSLNDVLVALAGIVPDLTKMNTKEIRKELEGVKLCFDGKNDYPLLDCVEGEIRTKGQAYFRINKCFYRLSGDYLSLVHLDFRRSLSNLLLKKEEEGALPLSWGGQKSHGHLTATAAGGKKQLEALAKKKVSYLDLKKTQADVCFTTLKGAILQNPLIRTYRDAIEKLLQGRKQMTLLSLETSLKLNKGGAKEIWEELTKERPVLEKIKDKYYVVNPLTDDKKLAKVLDPLCFAHFAKETEGNYNERYLEESNCIVGDRILPFGIEIFDLVRFTDTTTYIYHVKEGFDLHTRDALDQLMNAAEMIYEARYGDTKQNVLEEWYRQACNPTGVRREDKAYRAKLAEKMKKMGLEEFKKLFCENKLVFVYAILDHHAAECTLEKEMGLKENFQQSDFAGVLKQEKKTAEVAKEIFPSLQKAGFLDQKGRLTSSFYATAKDRFAVDFSLDIPDAAKRRIHDILSTQKSQFDSTIALLTLRRTRDRLQRYPFEFKVCQIKRSEYDESLPDQMPILYDFVSNLTPVPVPSVTYGFGGQQWVRKQETRGDGACSIHALLGNQTINNRLTFIPPSGEDDDSHDANYNEAAKNHFLDRMKEEQDSHFDEYLGCLEEAFQNDAIVQAAYQKHQREAKEALNQAKAGIDAFFLTLLDLPAPYPTLAPILKASDPKFAGFSDAQLLDLLKNDSAKRGTALWSSLDALHPHLTPFPEWDDLRNAHSAADDAFKEKRQEFYFDDDLFEKYREKVLPYHYHLSDSELELAAYLFDKRVILFSENAPPREIHPAGAETVAIFHEGNHIKGHYTRLEAQAP